VNRCVEFIGCVACGRYETAPKEDPGDMLMCCGIPMYGETFPVTPGNEYERGLAYVRARKWAKRARRDGEG
jgi:hypothetical protein